MRSATKFAVNYAKISFIKQDTVGPNNVMCLFSNYSKLWSGYGKFVMAYSKRDRVDTPIDITLIGGNTDSHEIYRPNLSTISHATAMP